MDPATYEFLQPTEAQQEKIQRIRNAIRGLSEFLEQELPEGPDRTYLIRKLREVAMWANITITRDQYGVPRE